MKLLAISSLLRDEAGATMVEYGLLVCLIAVIVAVSAQIVGTQLSVVFSNIGSYLTTVPTTP